MKNEKNMLAVRDASSVATMADVLSTDGMWERLCKVGSVLKASGFLGEQVTEAGAIAAAMTMASEGLNPVEFKRRYHIIGSTPSRTPGSLLGDFQQMGGTWKIVRADDEACRIEFRLGEMSYTAEVTMERMLQTSVPFSSKTGKLKENWANFPDDMLFARCCAKGLRRIAPGLMGGIYTREEVQDFSPSSGQDRDPISENEMRYRMAMAKGPQNAEPEKPASPDGEDGARGDDAIEAVVVEKAEAVDVSGHTAEPAAESASESASDRGDASVVCPIEGPYHDVPLADLGSDILGFLVDQSTLSKHPEMTPEIVAAVNDIIDARMKEVENA